MKFRLFFLIAVFVFLQSGYSFAQEGSSLNWDIDSVFGEKPPDDSTKPDTTKQDSTNPDSSNPDSRQLGSSNLDSTKHDSSQNPDETGPGLTASSLLKQRGFTFDASWDFLAGIAPGWDQTPWYGVNKNNFSWGQSAKMRANFGLDAQISEVFRTKTVVYFEIPDFKFSLGDFFFDYNLYNYVFIRAGKYDNIWGISPNYAFTNLLSRVPVDGPSGDSFLFKADIPVGIGGFQLLAQTRTDLMSGVTPDLSDIGYGGKYNLALRWVDMDVGAFYQNNMPLRSFLSLKATLGTTELYNEWLAVSPEKPADFSGAFNLGFIQDFFNGKLTANGELFYNAEKNAYWYKPETTIRSAEVFSYIDGLNLAFNLIYRFDAKSNPRLFIQALYAQKDRSAQLVPGVRLNPFPHSELYIAVPMSLGSKDGYYYYNTPDLNNRPFCIVLLLTLKGGVNAGFYN